MLKLQFNITINGINSTFEFIYITSCLTCLLGLNLQEIREDHVHTIVPFMVYTDLPVSLCYILSLSTIVHVLLAPTSKYFLVLPTKLSSQRQPSRALLQFNYAK